MVLDKFTVSPATGVVEAGGTALITVKFAAGAEAESFNRVLAMDVADRDPSEDAEGLLYELLAESCIPGVQTTDYVQIFEEQVIHPTHSACVISAPCFTHVCSRVWYR